jgi:hypothetical protein
MRLEGIELIVWIIEFLYVISALEYITIRGIIVLWPVAFYKRERDRIIDYIFIS